MAITDINEYSHLTEADVEALGVPPCWVRRRSSKAWNSATMSLTANGIE